MAVHPVDWWGRVANGVRASLRVKLTLMFVLVALIPMITIAFVSIGRASATITDQALSTALAENEAVSAQIEIFLAQFPPDLLTFANSPPIQGMIRAVNNGGTDPVSDDRFDVWAGRLSVIFSAAELSKKTYDQLRYLDEFGDEIVRVDFRRGQTIILTGTDQLQIKSDRPYFTETKKLARGEVLISELNLNRERGEIEVPYVPTLRYSTPVFDQRGDFKGIVISNVSAMAMLAFLDQTEDTNTYLATEDLSMAVHPDPEMRWGGDLGTGLDLKTDFSLEYAMLFGESRDVFDGSIVNKNGKRGEIVALRTLHFDPLRRERYWVVGSTITTATVLAGVNDLGNLVAGATVGVGLVAALLAFSFASGLASRVGAVSDAIGRISHGNLTTRITFRSRDEIGKLADSYRDMSVYLGEFTAAASRIAEGDLTADVRPTSKDDALGNAFSTMIAGLRDASEQRDAALELELENRELLRLNTVRNEFLSTVSHELRTPLTSLPAFGDILSRNRGGTLTSQQLEQLQLMRTNGWKLESLIDDLLDVSQSEAGSFKIEIIEFELSQAVRQIAALTSGIFEKKQQNLSVVIEIEPVRINGDEQRIIQVLDNLLTNASKYSPVRANIAIRLADSDGGVEISVSDDGVGIKQTDIVRLFTPFFRVDNEQTRRVGGTGLGLAISKTIVQLHGGTIYVESAPGVGTTFRVFLPTNKFRAAGDSPDA